jgi:predicted MFS family arabinose efflux permease
LRQLRGEGEAAARPSLADARRRYALVLANPASKLVFGMVAGEGLLIFGFFPFLAPLLAGHGGPLASPGGAFEAGVTISAFAVGGILYGAVVRRLLGLLGQLGMMRAGALVVGASLGAAGWAAAVPALPWLAFPAIFLVAGFGFYMLHNTMQTQGTELAPTARGSALALFACSFFVGQAMGPILFGAVAGAAGIGSALALAGLCVTALGLASAAALGRRPRQEA